MKSGTSAHRLKAGRFCCDSDNCTKSKTFASWSANWSETYTYKTLSPSFISPDLEDKVRSLLLKEHHVVPSVISAFHIVPGVPVMIMADDPDADFTVEEIFQ